MNIEEQDPTEVLNELLDLWGREVFESEYREEVDRETLRLEMLGILISKYAKWDINKVAKVCIEALHDCNFHDAAAAIENILNK